MSAKFKSTKKKVELEASIDDWDASEEEEEQQKENEDEQDLVKQTESIQIATKDSIKPHHNPKKVYQNAWDDGEEGASIDSNVGSSRIPKEREAKDLWEEANREKPQIQPIIQNRNTLPTTLLAPRLSSQTSSSSPIGSTSGSSGTNGEYDHRPPPQILRRDKNAEREAALAAAALAEANGLNKKKTLAEREEEYKRARERIFGATLGGGGGGETRSSSRTGSGSDTGGRNSPITTNTKTQRKKGR